VSACWASDPAQRPSFDELNQRFNEARMAHPSFREEPPQTSSASSAFVRELVVVVSSPGKTLEQEEVMKMVEATAETHADLIFGYDWAGSSTQDPRDGGVDWSDPDSVAESFWFKGFRERVKGQVLALAQLGYQLRLLCIEGGPISQLEARTMATMRAEIVADLQRKGYTPAVSTQLVSFNDFKQAFARAAGGAAAGGSAERLGPLSATDQQRDAEAEEKARKEQAKKEAEEGAKKEAEEKAKKEAEEKATKEAEEKAKKEAEEEAKKEAEEKARKEAAEEAKKEAEEEADRKAKKEAIAAAEAAALAAGM
jgi:DNA segregation ATPase FtsK/SpoIIIE-like protein